MGSARFPVHVQPTCAESAFLGRSGMYRSVDCFVDVCICVHECVCLRVCTLCSCLGQFVLRSRQLFSPPTAGWLSPCHAAAAAAAITASACIVGILVSGLSPLFAASLSSMRCAVRLFVRVFFVVSFWGESGGRGLRVPDTFSPSPFHS